MEKLKVCMNPALPTSYTEALSYLEEIGKLRYKLDQVIAAVNAGQTFYILPIATAETAGGVKAVSKTDESHKVAIDADGQIWSAYPTISDDQTLGLVKGTVKTDEDAMVAVDENGEMWYKTPEIATDKVAGIVKAIIKDAQTHKVAIDTDGQLYSDYPNVASTELGLVRGNSKTANQTTPVGIDSNGRMYVDTSIDLPQATGTQLGGVKAALATSKYTGDVRIDPDGELKVQEYTLPVANPSTIGGVKAFPIRDQTEPVGIDPTNNALYSKYPEIATDTTAGIVKVKAKTNETVEVAADADGKLYVPANAGIEVASDTTIGGIKAKARTNEDRKVAVGTDGYAYYKIPQASALEIGGIKAEPRTTETNEVRIDTTTGKLYASSSGLTNIPKASANTIGGILADPASGIDNIPVRISTDGHLFAENTRTTDAASTTTMGGIIVGKGGNDQGNPPTMQSAFLPDSVEYPLLAGKRIPYSVDTVDDGVFETYNTEVYIDLTETPPDQITGTKLNSYVNYATNHGYILSIYALDNKNKTRQFFDSGKDAGKNRVFTSVPYTDSGNKDKLTITTLTVYADTSGSESYFINDYVIEPTVIGPATASTYGTVKAEKKTVNETSEVKIDTVTGKLYAPATSGDSIYRLYDCGSNLVLPTTFWTEFLYPCIRAGKLPIIRITASSSSQTIQYTFTCDVITVKEPLETNIGILYFRCLQDVDLEEWQGSSNTMGYRVMKIPVATTESYHLSFPTATITLTIV